MKLGTEIGLGPGHIVLDGDPAPLQKRGHSPPIFPPMLWPNGWMDQDATWYGGRPLRRPHCVRWKPSSPSKRHSSPLARIFGPCLLCPNSWMDQDATYGGRPWPWPHCMGTQPPALQGAQPRIFGPCLLWPNGWMDQDGTCYRGRPRPRPHCTRWGPSSLRNGHSSPLFRPMSIVNYATLVFTFYAHGNLKSLWKTLNAHFIVLQIAYLVK